MLGKKLLLIYGLLVIGSALNAAIFKLNDDKVDTYDEVNVITRNFDYLYYGKLDFRPGDILPRADITYSLGSPAYRWLGLYVSTAHVTTLIFGDGTEQTTAGSGGGGSTNGTITASEQYNIGYYSASGTTTTIDGSTAFTIDGTSVVANGIGFEVDGGFTYLRERVYTGDDNSGYIEPSEGGETMGYDFQGIRTAGQIRTGIGLRPPVECWIDPLCIQEYVIYGYGDGGASTPTVFLDMGYGSYFGGAFSFHQEASTGAYARPMTISWAQHKGTGSVVGMNWNAIEVQGTTQQRNIRNGNAGSVLFGSYGQTNGEVDTDTRTINAILLEPPAISANGLQNSHSIVWTGHGYNSALTFADWKNFVAVSSQNATSTFTWQNRIDSNAYATKMQITDESNVIASTFTANFMRTSSITIGGVAFSTDTFQKRVTGTCAAGTSIATIDVNGNVTCETDDVGGGGGGASTLAVGTGTTAGWTGTITSSPTAAIVFSSVSYKVTLQGGATAYVKPREPRDQAFMYVLSVSSIAASSSTYMSLADIAHTVPAGATCHFTINVIFQTAATGTGIDLTLSTNTATYAMFSAQAQIPFAADGNGGEFQGSITAGNDTVRSTGVIAANTNYVARIDGVAIAAMSTPLTLTLQVRTEVAGSNATFRGGTTGWFWNLDQ